MSGTYLFSDLLKTGIRRLFSCEAISVRIARKWPYSLGRSPLRLSARSSLIDVNALMNMLTFREVLVQIVHLGRAMMEPTLSPHEPYWLDTH